MQREERKEVMKCVLLAVPLELIEEARLDLEGVLQMSAENNRIVLENARDTEDYLCDGDCENCPLDRINCAEREAE